MLFSIILPTYNRAKLLPIAIESVLKQTYENWELIIIDDGSTDNTKEILGQFGDPRIKYIYQHNQERSAARNRGIKEAKGEWICFLDSDDSYAISRLANWSSMLKKQDEKLALFYSELRLEKNFGFDYHFPQKDNDENVFEFLIRSHLFCQQVVGKKVVFSNNLFDPEISIGEDTELWIRIAEKYPIKALATKSYSLVHEHDDRSVNLKNKNSALQELKTLQKIFHSHIGSKIRKSIRSKVLANCYFNISKHYMYNAKKATAFKWVSKSLTLDWKSPQWKHRLYCLIMLLRGKIPSEYQ